MIEADFLNYQGSLEHAKDQFGVSENDSFAKARLGEEIPYYTVAKDSSTATDNGFALSGYLFPIELHGKQVGLVVAREANGKWSVLNISNEATLVQDIQSAKKLLPDPQDAKVVHDPSFTLYTLVSGKSIAPFQDQQDLKLKKNSVVPLAEFQANLEALKKAKLAAGKSQLVQLGGAGSADAESSKGTNKNYLLIGGGALVLGTIVLVLARRRNQTQR
jgi:hypothetical protein